MVNEKVKCRAKNPATCRFHGTPIQGNLNSNSNTTNDVRKLVSLRTIDSITPIEGADAIETAHIGGWTVVVRKGEFQAGDKAVYLEIDSLLPSNQPLFESFAKNGVRTQVLPDGSTVSGHVVKTMKLRGQVSQGLVFPLSQVDGLNENSTNEDVNNVFTKELGVVKYDPPIPTSLDGKVVGYFPTSFIEKTDSERVQNLSDEFLQSVSGLTWVPTEKVDGTSATFIKSDGMLRVCSRNLEFKYEPDNTENAYMRIAKELDLVNRLPEGAIIQGEIFGEGIQKNPLKIRGVQLRVFNTKNLDDKTPMGMALEALKVPALKGISFPTSVEEAVTQANGLKSHINPQVNAEGIVWWNKEGKTFPETGFRANFKAINNVYLLKHGG